MARADKAAAVAELADELRAAQAVVLTEYRGLTVKQLTTLRRSLDGSARFAIVKNTLTALAARDAGVPGLEERLTGPSAIAFVTGDPVEAARSLRDFARTNPLLVIKGGVLEGRPVAAEEIRKLADLESRDVLLAKLAGAMTASLSRAVSLFAAPLSQTARTVEALRAKAEQDPTALAAAPSGAGAPLADTGATDGTAAADTATDVTAAGESSPTAGGDEDVPAAPEAPLAPETPSGDDVPDAAEPAGSDDAG